MLIEDFAALDAFLAARDSEAPAHAFVLRADHQLRPEITSGRGYAPEGLRQIAARDIADAIGQLCAVIPGVGRTVFQVVNLDAKPAPGGNLVMRAVRVQGIPEHDAMLVISTDPVRISGAAAALTGSPLLETQAVWLIALRARSPDKP